jgi:hypothetical protein
MPRVKKASAVRRSPSAVLLALMLAGCGSGSLPPCDAPERQARATRVDTLPTNARDSIARAFAERPRIRQVNIEQAECHLHATVRVDSFATARYASTQGFALVRALKNAAPGETRPLVEDPASETGHGVYGYEILFDRRGAQQEGKALGEREGVPWVRLSKPYDSRRVVVRR